MNKAAAVVLAICVLGMIILWWNDWGNIRKPPFMNPITLAVRQEFEGHHLYIKYAFFDPLRYIICLEAGFLMIGGSVTWFYWKATRNLKETQGLIIACFMCSLMPLFELVGLAIWWWTCLVLIPSVVLGGLWLNWKELKKFIEATPHHYIEYKMNIPFKKAILTALLFSAYITILILAVLTGTHPLIPLLAFTFTIGASGKIYRSYVRKKEKNELEAH